jgi:hypothetical protein
LRELDLSYPVREKAKMPDALEPTRQNVEQEAAEEFHGVEGQSAEAVATLIVLVTKGHLAVFQSDEPVVRDGHAMRIPGQILQDVLGLAQRLLRIDDPFGIPEGPQEVLPGWRRRKGLTATGPRQCPAARGLLEGIQEQPPKAATEDLHWEEKVWATGDPPGPVGRQAPSGEDTVEMRMMVELLAPGMEHREAAEVRPEMLGVASDVLERLYHSTKEHAVEHAGIVETQGAEGVGQGKHHMDVRNVKDLALSSGEPGRLRSAVALGAVPIATGVIADLFVATLVTLRFVAPQGGGATEGDGA